MGNQTKIDATSWRERDHSKGALDTRIKSVGRRGSTLDRDVHALAVDTMCHTIEHGDATLLTRLRRALPSQARKQAFDVYVRDFIPVKLRSKDESFGMAKNWAAKVEEAGGVTAIIDRAEGTPFWEYTKEKNPAPFSLEKVLESVAKRLAKQREADPNTVPDRERVEAMFHSKLAEYIG